MISQVLLFAAQEGAKIAARTPDLSNNATRDMVRGFTTAGVETNPNSVIFTALASAGLLSQPVVGFTPPTSGNLPPGASVQILPWDAGAANAPIPPGTIAVIITYPFELIGNPFNSGKSGPPNLALAMSFTAPAIQFPNFNIAQQAVAAEEVYQQ